MSRKKVGLLIIFITIFIELLGFGIIIPIVPFYLESYFISPESAGRVLGLLMAIFALMQLFFSPMIGRLSDRIGRRPVILISLFLSGTTHIVFAAAPNIYWLFGARIFTGIAAATVPTAMAYIADITTPENRAKGMGLIGMAFGLGFVLGPALGGLFTYKKFIFFINSLLPLTISSRFVEENLLRIPILFAAGMSFTAFLLAYFFLGESLKAKKTKTAGSYEWPWEIFVKALRHERLNLLFIIFFLSSLSFSALESTFAFLLERKFSMDSSHTGFMFGFLGLTSAIVQGGLIRKLVPRFGEIKIIRFALTGLAISFFLLPRVSHLSLIFLTLGVLAFSMGLNNPSMFSLISRNSPSAEQGGILGVNQSFASLARTLGPFSAGFIFDHFGYSAPYTIAAGLFLTAFLISFRFYPVSHGIQGEES